MLIGEFQHNIDDKGRVFIPVRLRGDLGESFIISRWLDNCLSAYSQSEWEVLRSHISELPTSKSRDLKRFFFSSANDVALDRQGRIVIPPNLREYAGLAHDVMIIGASNHIEIWDKARWDDYYKGITAESVAAAMDEFGF